MTENPKGSQIEVRILQSMPELLDHLGNRMSVHYRIVNDKVEVIINRSCNKCESFRKIYSGEEICVECKYLKNWLERGKR